MKFQYVIFKAIHFTFSIISSYPPNSKKKEHGGEEENFNFEINFQFSSIQKAIEKTSKREREGNGRELYLLKYIYKIHTEAAGEAISKMQFNASR